MQSQLISDRPMRILTPQLTARLRMVTDAHRLLSSLRCTVVRQDLRLDDRRPPLLMLKSGNERLRACMTQIATTAIDGRRQLVGRLLSVDVCWPLDPAH